MRAIYQPSISTNNLTYIRLWLEFGINQGSLARIAGITQTLHVVWVVSTTVTSRYNVICDQFNAVLTATMTAFESVAPKHKFA
ncbi:hypothetical protein ABK735_15195 [Enterobacter kobei]|nr:MULTISPECIES: hypothetical protein [Enterobacteriaceae]MCC9341125.1 hypothetical protein [Enterobacter hormaechei subsp. steigerwaltii]MCC9397246.1 hypothetical protein [Enterobacter hormaechei subsp. steigerwaltii]MCC9461604.1 hypothetical protein [Enterobacter hormaechei subsp. steigerwaltii]MCC9589969.1 hypothetical protein [Enterobacter hormaechei subsp. steigerwaltii]MCR2779680.1 hypothetical protein [Enterobacter hormaechei]